MIHNSKKCPFCDADLPDKALFCIDCMNTLNPKKVYKTKKGTRKPIIATLLSITVVFIFGLFFLLNQTFFKNSTNNNSVLPKQEETAKPFVNSQSQPEPETQPEIETKPEPEPENETEENSQTQTESQVNTEQEIQTETEIKSDLETDPDTEPKTIKPEYEVDPRYNGLVLTSAGEVPEDGIYIVPSTFEGQPVVGIASHSFADMEISEKIKSIILPETLYYVTDYAFAYCYNLKNVYFYQKETTLSERAFFHGPEYALLHFPRDTENTPDHFCPWYCMHDLDYYIKNGFR